MKDRYQILLVAIVVMCVALMATSAVLILSGNSQHVANVAAIFMPIILSLMAAKMSLLRDQNNVQDKKLEEIQHQTNGGFRALTEQLVAAKAEIARLNLPK